jgi:cellulase/cellobiase CelA1
VADGGTWDKSNDPSYLAGTAVNKNVPLYEAGKLIWGQEPGASSPSPTPSPTTSSPSPTPSPTTSPTSSPTPTPTFTGTGCRVTYSVNDWGGGFTGTITIANPGSAAWSGWTLAFAFPGNQKISQGWSATWAQSGTQVTATSLSYNGSVPGGGSTSIGFNGTYTGTNIAPTAFTVNGMTCTRG